MALRVMSMAEIRLEVLLEAARSGETVTEVCRRHGISRETYYVYLRRYQGEGIEGLESRSRQPQRQPARMASDIEVEICRMRKDHPRWGARRIRAELRRAGKVAPAVSSVHQALVRNHLVALQPPTTQARHHPLRAGGAQRPVADRRHRSGPGVGQEDLGHGHPR